MLFGNHLAYTPCPLTAFDRLVKLWKIEKLRSPSSDMLFLKNTPIDQIVSMDEIIVAIEDALKEMALGRGVDLPRRRIHHPTRMIFGLLPGSVHGVMGAYLTAVLARQLDHE